jgi:hypothetical protein
MRPTRLRKGRAQMSTPNMAAISDDVRRRARGRTVTVGCYCSKMDEFLAANTMTGRYVDEILDASPGQEVQVVTVHGRHHMGVVVDEPLVDLSALPPARKWPPWIA